MNGRRFWSLVSFLVGVNALGTVQAWSQNSTMNPFTRKQCEDFKASLTADSRVQVGQFSVPRNYNNQGNATSQEQINLMYWMRPSLGGNTEFPPLLLIHGGVGGNSNGMFTWKKIMDEYPGPVVSLDLRGEGCSNFFNYLRSASEFGDVTIEATLRDLEALRKKLFGETRWRVFGQSRGSAIVHRYIESYPSSLESAFAHGLAMQTQEGYKNYSLSRSHFNARAGRTFYAKFPEAAKVIEEIRLLLKTKSICLTLNFGANELDPSQRPQVCGAQLVDAFSGRMSGMGGWKGFADSLLKLKANGTLDEEGAKNLLQTTLDSSLYVRYGNYIFGTNTLEFHAPDPQVLKTIKNDPVLAASPLSEGRFIAEVIYPIYVKMFGDNVSGSHRPYDFARVVRNIEERKSSGNPLRFTVYMSEHDPVAGPEAFEDEKRLLGASTTFVYIPNTSHDGWKQDPVVANDLLEKPKTSQVARQPQAIICEAALN